MRNNEQAYVLVVGSFMMDLVVRTPRMPETGETIIGTSFQRFPGGKGANQAAAAAKLGAQVRMAGKVGADPFGDQMLSALESHGVDVQHVLRDAAEATGIGSITLDAHGYNRIVVVPGANLKYTVDDLKQIEGEIKAADILLLQLEIPLETVAAAVNLAAEHNVPVILNPAPAQPLSPEILRGVSYLTPNEKEAGLLSGVHITGLDTARQAAARLLEMGVGHVVITLGEQGAVYAGQAVMGHVPAFSVEVVDTVAAGDAFNAGLAVALTQGNPLPEAVRFASAVGALAVTKHGAIPSLPTLAEVQELLGAEGSLVL
ncbi:MAG TPA: ribokinase [Firmicutes bacterium]|jgi:ribokinase|nr:MAG: ribokinase [Peptococcaceae bacterium 1109]HHT72236.1 ribokinase [Bacillota bacterium]